jgi:hypothetical protein
MSLKYEIRIQQQIIRKYVQHRRHGQVHRINGPAELWDDGAFFWCQYDQQHRIGGPARFTGSPMNYEFYMRDVKYVPNVSHASI